MTPQGRSQSPGSRSVRSLDHDDIAGPDCGEELLFNVGWNRTLATLLGGFERIEQPCHLFASGKNQDVPAIIDGGFEG